MYEIKVEPMGKQEPDRLTTSLMLGTMLDVLESVKDSDDSTFVLKMKLNNNIEFLVDQLMTEYEQGRK
jgi:predicted transcriptional regulator